MLIRLILPRTCEIARIQQIHGNMGKLANYIVYIFFILQILGGGRARRIPLVRVRK